MRIDHLKLLPHMEDIGHEIYDKVLKEREKFDPQSYTKDDILKALNNKIRTTEDLKALLSIKAGEFLEDIAKFAQKETREKFGNNITLFTPLYISNFCDNHCVYCGFNCKNDIKRAKLNEKEIENEMKEISKSGLQEILILTGESEMDSDINYIANACKIAKKFFKIVSVEIYPVNSCDYKKLHEAGVDFVIVFQETYNEKKYEKLHLAGNKRIFPYRFNAQERAVIGGMRGVGFAALLGLDDFRLDAFCTAFHASLIQKKYPKTEIAFSVPRLRPIINNGKINPKDVGQRELLQVIMAYRLFLPTANITISTRENAFFRDNSIKIATNKISAGVNVGIGAHSGEEKGDEQFEIADNRSVKEICKAIKDANLQPLMSEYIYV